MRKSAKADLRWLAWPKRPGKRLRVTAKVIGCGMTINQPYRKSL
jgi:hypothetical protein